MSARQQPSASPALPTPAVQEHHRRAGPPFDNRHGAVPRRGQQGHAARCRSGRSSVSRTCTGRAQSCHWSISWSSRISPTWRWSSSTAPIHLPVSERGRDAGERIPHVRRQERRRSAARLTTGKRWSIVSSSSTPDVEVVTMMPKDPEGSGHAPRPPGMVRGPRQREVSGCLRVLPRGSHPVRPIPPPTAAAAHGRATGAGTSSRGRAGA